MPVRSRASKYNKLRSMTLKWSALKYDLEPDEDFAKPGNSPPARAFQLLNTGFDLAIEIASTGIPSLDKKTQKRGAKWLIEDTPYREGPMGINMLAIALPLLLARTGGDLFGAIDGPTPSVEQDKALEDVVTDFFPLPNHYVPWIEEAVEEFEVMETKQPRPQVFNDLEPGSAYSQALKKGEDPDQNPDLVAEQRRWARDYFISVITKYSCFLILGRDWGRLEDKMVTMVETGERIDEFREYLLGAWVRGSQSYLDYARMDEGR
jgi:hypothetical protein